MQSSRSHPSRAPLAPLPRSDSSPRSCRDNLPRAAPGPLMYPAGPCPKLRCARSWMSFGSGVGGVRALSAVVFTVAMDVSGLPPFAQRTHKGWGTRSCVNTQLENAVAALRTCLRSQQTSEQVYLLRQHSLRG